MKRLLVTGSSGLLGSNLTVALEQHCELLACYHRHRVQFASATPRPLDIGDPSSVSAVFGEFRPDTVIHCAAETRVDYCEENQSHALAVNATGTGNVARAAADAQARFVYISTDSVFDGRRGSYVEDDEPNPLNAYAESKLRGERLAVEASDACLIVRTNIFGWNARPKSSLSEWVVDRARHGEQIPGFVDVRFGPILVNDLAAVLRDALNAELTGLYHVASSDSCSKFEFARQLCRTFDLPLGLVSKAALADASLTAPRPMDTSLHCRKISSVLDRPMPLIEDGLKRLRELEDCGYVDRLQSRATT